MSKSTAKVISPTALSEQQLERVRKVINNIADGDIVMKNEIDEDMSGGIKVKFGTKVIDLSLENMIDEMKEEIDE